MGSGIDHDARLRALVVDGNVDTATTLSCLLQVAGCSAAVAFGASMATRVARLFQPTLVLLDMERLAEAGCEIVQALRVLDGPVSDAVLVCLAPEASRSDAQRWLAAGCDQVVCKPLQPHLLAELLAQAQAAVEVRRYRDKAAHGPGPEAARTGGDSVPS